MKTLNVIQTLSKIAKVFSTIIFVCAIVGLCLCAVAACSLAFGFEGIKIGGVTVESMMPYVSSLPKATRFAITAQGALFCVAAMVLFGFIVEKIDASFHPNYWVLALGGLVYMAVSVSESQTNFPNVRLNGIDVSGLTQTETLEKLNAAGWDADAAEPMVVSLPMGVSFELDRRTAGVEQAKGSISAPCSSVKLSGTR